MENPIWFPYGWTFISHLPMTGALCSGSTTGVRALVKYHETAPENRGVGRRAGRGHLASWTSPLAGKFTRGFPKVAGSAEGEPGEGRPREVRRQGRAFQGRPEVRLLFSPGAGGHRDRQPPGRSVGGRDVFPS